MSLQAIEIRRSEAAPERRSIRRTPSDNRDLAQQHEALVHRRGSRRSLAISLFAFFATILTLFWFALTGGWAEGAQNEARTVYAAVVEGTGAAEADAAGGDPGLQAPIPGVSVSAIAVDPAQAEASGRPAVPHPDEYASFYSVGDPDEE